MITQFGGFTFLHSWWVLFVVVVVVVFFNYNKKIIIFLTIFTRYIICTWSLVFSNLRPWPPLLSCDFYVCPWPHVITYANLEFFHLYDFLIFFPNFWTSLEFWCWINLFFFLIAFVCFLFFHILVLFFTFVLLLR